jgi:hypothetical protein
LKAHFTLLLGSLLVLPRPAAAVDDRGPAPVNYKDEAQPSGTTTPVPDAAAESETGGGNAAAEAATPSYPTLTMIGFTDLNYQVRDVPDRTARSGFFEGQFVLHFTSALSSRFAFFAETSLTARPDAAFVSTVPGFNAEVERSILKYTQSDRLQLSIGRYHTPISYWNTAYHHGAWLQTTMARPEMIQIGGQFLPVHFVGALAEGTLPSGPLNVSYNLGLGNGRSSVISRAGDAVDVNDHRAWLLGLSAKPDHPFGLQVGGALYRDVLTLQGNGANLRETILTAHLSWTKETPELIAEYASVRHHAHGGRREGDNWAYYVQLAYRLGVLKTKLKPYARFEDFHIDDKDAVFEHMSSRRVGIAGLRMDASDLVALKVEYRRQTGEGAAFRNAVLGQVSLTF